MWWVLTVQDVEETLRRMLIVARLPAVEKLNGSPVSSEERDKANRCFVRHYTDAEIKPSR